MTIFKTLGQERSHTPEWSSVFSPSSPTKKFENYHHKIRVGDIKVRLQLFLLFFGIPTKCITKMQILWSWKNIRFL